MTDNELKTIRQNISCPQFGDDHYGSWGALRLGQRRTIRRMLDEIISQKEENSNLTSRLTSLQNDLTSAKTEAIKEFAERLKTKASDFEFGKAVWVVYIDNLVKEMVGDDK